MSDEEFASQHYAFRMAMNMPLVDAVMFLQPPVTATVQLPVTSQGSAATGEQISNTSSQPSQPSDQPRTKAQSAIDRLLPVALLKCPLSVFTAFTTEYSIHPAVVEALRSARRRKVNRRAQRITRNRKLHDAKKHVNQESDDEGDCTEIDSASAYTQLVEASKRLSV